MIGDLGFARIAKGDVGFARGYSTLLRLIWAVLTSRHCWSDSCSLHRQVRMWVGGRAAKETVITVLVWELAVVEVAAVAVWKATELGTEQDATRLEGSQNTKGNERQWKALTT